MRELTQPRDSDDIDYVGGIFDIDYEEAKVQTTDKKMLEAGGISKHTFLIAVADGLSIEGESMIPHCFLLRVKEFGDVPHGEELLEARYRDAERVTAQGLEEAKRMDDYTNSQVQQTSLVCDLIGTYEMPSDSDYVSFSEGVHTMFGSAAYNVYKPQSEALEKMISLISQDVREDDTNRISDTVMEICEKDDNGEEVKTNMVSFGDVKYSSPNVSVPENENKSSLFVKVEDFVGREKGNKTGIIGMTRTGKSNTIKLIASAIHFHSDDVGQLIYDPAGEYANKSPQDDYCLGTLDNAVRYKYNPTDEEVSNGFKRLANNLFKIENLEIAKSTVRELLREDLMDGIQYVEDFVGTIESRAVKDGNTSDNRYLAAFYAALADGAKEDIEAHDEWDGVRFNPKNPEQTISESRLYLGASDTDKNGNKFTKIMYDADDVGLLYEDGKQVYMYDVSGLPPYFNSLADSDIYGDNDNLSDVLQIFSTPHSGTNKLNSISDFHNADSEMETRKEIYKELSDGSLVVIDMSNGREDVVSEFADSYTNYIYKKSEEKFVQNENPPRIQLYLEEAHRYFDEDKYEGSMSPYVRAAKEGGKFKIGMVYATQEFSSVADRVLYNTANYIITHLNNKSEIKELSEFNDFEVFSETTRKATEPGFARVKMLSNKFTVPVKVEEFNTSWVENNEEDSSG